jgi:hypothetical protein
MGFLLAAAAVIVGLIVLMAVRRRGTEDGDLSLDDSGRQVSDSSDRHRPESDHRSGPGNYGF